MLCDFEAAQMADRPNLKRPPMPCVGPPSKRSAFSLEAFIAGEEMGASRSPSQHMFNDDFFGDSVFTSPFDTIDSLDNVPDDSAASTMIDPIDPSNPDAPPHSISPDDILSGGGVPFSSNMYNEPDSPNGFLFP